MSLISTIKTLGRHVIDLVFPISCLICGKDGQFLCADCPPKIPKLQNQLCIVCRKPAPFGKTHPSCVTRNTVDGSIAALDYKDPKTKNLIRVFKYDFVSQLGNPLSKLIVETLEASGLADYFSGWTVVPVPLHPKRLNWRSFNQSELLAQELAARLGVEVNRNLITRAKNTTPQADLKHADERRRNIENAFSLLQDPRNQKIILVDDLVTSGATANEIAKLLKQGGAQEVWIIAAAHG